jgi:DNA-binding transcriptional ArsR family regulator
MGMERKQKTLSVDVFHAISDPTRRRLLTLMANSELPVNELASAFAMSRPAISQHLRVLLQAGLVLERRVGRERHYRLHAAPLREVSEWVKQYEQFWLDKLQLLGEQLERDQ